VGQSPIPQDNADAMTALSLMMQQWQRRRWIVFRLDDAFTPVTPWQGIYTVGPGGDFDFELGPPADRPGTIESAFLRQLTGLGVPDGFPVDYPLRKIPSKEAWNRIPLKHLGSWPFQYFYDPTWKPDNPQGTGTLYIWPIPIQSFFEVHISVPRDIRHIPPYTDLTDYLPPETEMAIVYNLAAVLRVNYQMPPDPQLLALARSTVGTLRTVNYAAGQLRMPDALKRQVRFKNPLSGHYPEVSAGMPYPTLL